MLVWFLEEVLAFVSVLQEKRERNKMRMEKKGSLTDNFEEVVVEEIQQKEEMRKKKKEV